MRLAQALPSWSLRKTLFFLVSCCIAPIALAAAGLVYLFVTEEYRRAERELADRAALMLGAVELRIQAVLSDLQVLAASPTLQAGDLAAFREHMLRANGIYDAFGTVLVDRSGQLVISTRRQPGEPLPKRTVLDTQEKVFVTGQPQISGVVPSTADKAPIISIEVPVVIDGEVRYVLAAGLSPRYVADEMNKHIPAGWLGSLVDARGLLISRTPDLQLVGQPVIPGLQEYVGRTSPKWFASISRDGTPIYTYSHFTPTLGWTAFISTPRHLAGQNVRWNSAVLAVGVAAAFLLGLLLANWFARRILTTLEAFEHNVLALGKKESLRPIPSALVEVNRMQGVLADVKSELDTSEKKIENERTLLRQTVQAMPVGVVILGLDGKVLLANSKAQQLWATPQLKNFDDFTKITRRRLDGSDYPPKQWPISRALNVGEVVQNEEVFHFNPDGSKIRICINAAPVTDGSGKRIAAVAAFYDTTELNAALDQHKMLLEEINHRVNNTMSTIQAIAVLTRPGVTSVGEYVTAFQKRLMALAHAYRLLTDNNWKGADICDIAKGILAPFGDKQVDFDGPRVELSAVLTLAIAAALQELATNAAKYGSLSVPSGCVKVRWRVEDDQLYLIWRESNGPVVVEPTRRGFGSRFIQDTLKTQVGWDVEVEYASAGLKFSLTLKLESHGLQVPHLAT